MVAITRALAPSDAVGARSARASPALDANLRTCRAQLMDWVTCPSAKTPPGKAKIEQITAKMDVIKAQIKKSDAGTATDADPSNARLVQPTAVNKTADNDFAGYLDPTTRLGTQIDTHA